MKAREQRVKNCKTCNGSPKSTSSFTAYPFEGIKCDECLEIIDYEPIASLVNNTTTKVKQDILDKEPLIKPNLDFDKFKIVKDE